MTKQSEIRVENPWQGLGHSLVQIQDASSPSPLRMWEEDLGVVEWLSNLDGTRWETDGHLDEGGTMNLPF